MILGATPIILAALITTTPPTTIHTTHQEAHVVATLPDRSPGGGSNRQNRNPKNPLQAITNPTNPRTSGYPSPPRGVLHPIANTRPTTFTETTNRPR